jgi:hypothetical protein
VTKDRGDDRYTHELVSCISKLRWLMNQVSDEQTVLRKHMLECIEKLELARKRDGVIKKFLHYSFEDIHYTYTNLTEQEQGLCTKEQFEELMAWLRHRG